MTPVNGGGKNQGRVAGGTPAGGQFATGAKAPANLLDIDMGTDTAFDLDSEAPSLEEVAGADGEQLWEYVRHPDPFVRMDAATAPALTDEQLEELASPDQHFLVRQTVAHLPHQRAGELAAADPDPIVRWLALQHWALSDETRQRVLADPGVREVITLLSKDAPPVF